MKNTLIIIFGLITFNYGCGTVQSIIKSTFPYTATLVIPNDVKSQTLLVATSAASSLDQALGNESGTSYIKEVKVASARLTAIDPSNFNMGILKAVKLYLVKENGGEVMIASRSDVAENIGNTLVLDIDNSRFVDDYIKGNNLKIKMEYTLRNELTTSANIRTTINLSASPDKK